jgi:hypothetical protein
LSKSLLSDNIASNGRLIVLRGCSSSCCYCACFTIREQGVPALKNWCPLMRQQQDSHCLESWLTASNDNPHSTQTQQPQGNISTWSVPDSIVTSHHEQWRSVLWRIRLLPMIWLHLSLWSKALRLGII